MTDAPRPDPQVDPPAADQTPPQAPSQAPLGDVLEAHGDGPSVDASSVEEAVEPEAKEAPLEEPVAPVAAGASAQDGPDEETALDDEVRPALRGRHHRLRWVGAIVAVLVVAAGLGFGAAALIVPRLADASPPAPTVPSSPTPAATGTLRPSPTPTASPSPGTATPAPPRASPTTYLVRRNDTLASIAARFGVSVAAIVQANKITDANHIEVGQRLIIPAPTPSPPPTASPS